jgi:hypothetical protein
LPILNLRLVGKGLLNPGGLVFYTRKILEDSAISTSQIISLFLFCRSSYHFIQQINTSIKYDHILLPKFIFNYHSEMNFWYQKTWIFLRFKKHGINNFRFNSSFRSLTFTMLRFWPHKKKTTKPPSKFCNCSNFGPQGKKNKIKK